MGKKQKTRVPYNVWGNIDERKFIQLTGLTEKEIIDLRTQL